MTTKTTLITLILAYSATMYGGQSNNITNEIDTKEIIFSSSDKKLTATFERSQKWHSPTPTMATIPLVIGTKQLYQDAMLFVCVMPPTNVLQQKY